jgi:Ca2+-binding RTX toxin-like protein
VVRRIDSVYGGYGADHLAGTSGPNIINGGGGHDTLNGRDGDDIFGGIVFPIPSPPRAGARGDAVVCGGGTDEIDDPGRNNYIRPGCEALVVRRRVRAHTVPWRVSAYPEWVNRNSLTYPYQCSYDEDWDNSLWTGLKCPGTVTLREAARPNRLLASGRLHALDPWALEAGLELTTAGRQLAGRKHGVQASVGFRGKNLPIISWRVRLTR